jgi:hypothetical protein
MYSTLTYFTLILRNSGQYGDKNPDKILGDENPCPDRWSSQAQ